MRLEEAFLIDGKPVRKIKEFLGFQVFELVDDNSHYNEEITLFYVKKGKVVGKIKGESYGGAEGSSSLSIEFTEITQ